MAAPKTRVLSGIQPSGELHIGNWLGAVRTWKATVDAATDDSFYCIADAHALTAPHEPGELRERIDLMATDLVACGVDPERCTLFVQSDVREHTELAWYFGTLTPTDDLSRMTQLTDKSDGTDTISSALFSYPVLMSADILLYKANVVPVGEDQLQHLELVRETARRWNFRYGNLFPEPQPASGAVRIMGLDGQAKMDKSKGNAIAVFEDEDSAWTKLRGAYTDPQRLKKSDPGRPSICNVFTMHTLLSPAATQDEVRVNCTGGKWSCLDCKKVLRETMEREIVPLRAKRAELSTKKVRDALGDGAAKARRIARETMREVREALGLGSLAESASS